MIILVCLDCKSQIKQITIEIFYLLMINTEQTCKTYSEMTIIGNYSTFKGVFVLQSKQIG